MLRKTMADIDVKLGLKLVREKIINATSKRDPELDGINPILVAVSKTKPNDLIIQAYEYDQRDFGENYVQELCDKGNDETIRQKCKDIRWHFIGHLQRNKVNKLLSTPGLYCVQTVDSEKLAVALNKAWQQKENEPEMTKEPLKIMLQVNTSDEEEKNGMRPEEVTAVAKTVLEKCPHLYLDGLMTIGRFGYDVSQGPNPDFVLLKQCRERLCKDLNFDWKRINLSMGMSDDYEHAIQMGSTIIRVGSSIFGVRSRKE